MRFSWKIFLLRRSFYANHESSSIVSGRKRVSSFGWLSFQEHHHKLKKLAFYFPLCRFAQQQRHRTAFSRWKTKLNRILRWKTVWWRIAPARKSSQNHLKVAFVNPKRIQSEHITLGFTLKFEVKLLLKIPLTVRFVWYISASLKASRNPNIPTQLMKINLLFIVSNGSAAVCAESV